MAFFIALRSEILKTKRTSLWYLTLLAAAFAPLMVILELVTDGVDPKHRGDYFNNIMNDSFMITAFVAFPLFLILVCTLLVQIEYKNNTWKQVLTSPQTKGTIFLAKFVNIHLLIVLFLVANFLLTLFTVVFLHFMDPSLHVLQQPLNVQDVFITRGSSYVALLAICAMQFWLSLRFRNFITPLAIGLALWFTGTILVIQEQSGLTKYFPYSYHAHGSAGKYNPQFTEMHWYAVGYALTFLLVGFLDFKRRRMTA
jgi:hypothetical protein